MGTIEEQAFDKGVLWAVARIVELFDEPTIAKELLKESGAKLSRADEYDLPFIRKAMRWG